MGMIVSLLALLATLANLGCLIFVVIQMNTKEGIVKAILGFICGIYGFIWGWMNRDAHPQMPTVMLVWSGCIVANIVLQMLAGAVASGS